MKKVLKLLGIVLGGLLGLIIMAVVVLAGKGNSQITRTYVVQVNTFSIPNNDESIARGEHLVQAICIGCHQPTLSGGPFFEAPFGKIYAANLTPGEGGLGASYSDKDWIRSIRHGIRPDGTSVLVMPSQFFWNFSDEDLGAIIAYIKSLSPLNVETSPPSFNIIGKALLGAGVFGDTILPAGLIDHDQRPTNYPEQGETPAYGEYLVHVSGCQDCHGEALSGGKGADPEALSAPNLTPGGELANWSNTDFINTIREGVTPDGHKLDANQMPWEHYKYFYDDELGAIFLYLQSLPASESTSP